MPSYEEVTQRAGSRRAMTGLTDAEFQALVPHFEQAFVTSLEQRTLEGQPRTSRRYRAYVHCPLPPIADKLLFLLSYLQHKPMHARQGQPFGMAQSHANQWRHRLHAVLHRALASQDLLPARPADEVAARLARHKTDTPPFWAGWY